MGRAVRVLVGLVLLASGVLLGLYGLFAILYRGDSGGNGDTYVTFSGHEIDARLVGAVALLIVFVLVLLALAFLRRERTYAKRA